jgi:hypothetical protein
LEEKKSAIIEVHYLPVISYFSVLKKIDTIVLEGFENFAKQSYRNRCLINTSQGSTALTVPLTDKHGKVIIKDIRIDYRQKWLNNHWRTIQTAYGNAPFFEYYSHELHDVLFKKCEFLFDLNYDLLSLCLKWLKWEKKIQETLTYSHDPSDSLDLRNVINVKKREENNVNMNDVPYTQVFGNKFVSDLSIIDLVFCVGPQANKYITPS